MSHRFELGLYLDRSGKTILPLAQCVQRLARGEPVAPRSLEDTTLFLETDGKDWMPVKWVLGDLRRLVLQIEAALPRLRQGDFAIVRSAVDDREPVTYLLFEPEDEMVHISNFFLAGELGYVYPVDSSERAAALYDYVADHRDDLLVRPDFLPVESDIKRAPFPYPVLLDSMAAQAELGRRLYADLGLSFD